MRLTLVIASVIFTAVLTYAKLMAMAHDSSPPNRCSFDHITGMHSPLFVPHGN